MNTGDLNLVQIVFDRSRIGGGEDTAVITCHIRKTVENFFDLVPVDDDTRQAFVNNIGNMWTTMQVLTGNKLHLLEARFYAVQATAGAPMGDPVLVHTYDVPGTSSGKLLPPQVAVSVTFKTPTRKRWGRFYWPGLTDSYLMPDGRLDPGICPQIADAVHNLTDRSGTGAALVVWSPTHRSYEDPTQIQVDDLYDVIRRRRYDKPTVRATLSAG